MTFLLSRLVRSGGKTQSCGVPSRGEIQPAGNHGDHEEDLQGALWLLLEETAACSPTSACMALYKHDPFPFRVLS